jgi:N-acetyl-gamma-glutamyl-phosphate reductase
MQNKIKVGIVGSAGYTGGELIRLLLLHPFCEIVFANSKSNANKKICEVHADLIGETDLKFSADIKSDIDVLFLCVGHGEAKLFLEKNKISNSVTIIDLSQDNRLNPEFVYGLCEMNGATIKSAKRIANPGCFATAIQLALLPLAKNNLLNNEIHISATTGSTGAGQSHSGTSHFSWRQNNLSVYKAFEHQHLAEINQSLKKLQLGFNQEINFVPMRGSFTRGILASIYTDCTISLPDAKKIFDEFYQNSNYVFLSEAAVDLKQVVNTNKCLLHVEQHGKKIFIVSAIDNLLKGASGQAVQNMNIAFGLKETEGLKLKATTF